MDENFQLVTYLILQTEYCNADRTTLFFFIRMLFFRPRLNILIFLPILGLKYSCIILKIYWGINYVFGI